MGFDPGTHAREGESTLNPEKKGFNLIPGHETGKNVPGMSVAFLEAELGAGRGVGRGTRKKQGFSGYQI